MNFFIHKLLGWRENFPDGHYKLLAILDSRTSQVCRDHHGKKYAVKAAKVGENFPPLHPWCRSTVVLVFDEVAEPVVPVVPISLPEPQAALPTPTHTLPTEKQVPSHKSFKLDYLATATPNSHKVVEAEYYEYNGIRYSENLVYDHDEYEIGIAKWLEDTLGGEIELVPRVVIPKGVSTPDFMFRGERLDLKHISTEGNRVIDGAIKKKKKQAENLILDFTDSKLTDDEIMKQVTSVFGNRYRSWVKMMILSRDGKIIEIIKRI